MFTRKKYHQESGLSLIELIVAMGIFSLVVTMIVSVFSLVLSNQRQIIALRNVEDNVRFAMESMAREIRTGRDFSVNAGSLSFINAKNEAIWYSLTDGMIVKSTMGGEYLGVTDPITTIDYLKFNLLGNTPNDGLQPRITIAIGATSQVANKSVNLKVQTTISSRYLQN